MSLQNLALYIFSVIVVTLSPGPDILLVIAVAVAQGMRAGFAATLGFATGLIVHTTIAATGLALIIRSSPTAFRVVQFFGAAYLAYLAVRLIFARDNDGGAEAEKRPTERRGLWRVYQQCILMNVLNPKVTLFFLSFLPDFVAKDKFPVLPSAPVWMQFVMLSGIFAACTLVCFGACAACAGYLSGGLRTHRGAAKWMRWGTGALFLTLAVLLVVR